MKCSVLFVNCVLSALLFTACSSPEEAPKPSSEILAPAVTKVSETVPPMDLISSAAADAGQFGGSTGDSVAESTVSPEIVAKVKETLKVFGEGCVAPDVEAAMGVVSEDFAMDGATDLIDKAGFREALTERMVYSADSAISYDMDALTVEMEGDKLFAKSLVLKRASRHNIWCEFEMREEFGEWRITNFFPTSGVD